MSLISRLLNFDCRLGFFLGEEVSEASIVFPENLHYEW